MDKQDRDIRHAAIDNTPWTCITVTSSPTQLVDVPINRLKQVRLEHLSCDHKQHALDKHDHDTQLNFLISVGL